jgi:hypothetical protein
VKKSSTPSIQPAENVAGILHKVISDAGVDVVFGDGKDLKKMTAQETHDLFLNRWDHVLTDLPFTPLPVVLAKMGLRNYPIEEETIQVLVSNFFELKDKNETEIQKNERYQQVLHGLEFVDSHSTPTILMNKRVHSNSNDASAYEVTRTGKGDGVHLQFPCILEIKGKDFSHLKGLIQGIKRATASISSYGLFSKHLTLVHEKRLAFLIYGETGGEEPIISIYLLSTSDFTRFMFVLQENLKNPSFNDWYYHSHSANLLKVFKAIETSELNGNGPIKWSNCQIFKLAKSGSCVYKLVIGKENSIDSLTDQTYIIKINSDIRRHLTEIGALQKMSNYYRLKGKRYYAVGYCSGESDQLMLFQSPSTRRDTGPETTSIDVNNSSSSDTEKAWYDDHLLYLPTSSSHFGAIIMEEGQSIGGIPFTFEMYQQLAESIIDIHEADIVHRDLRSNNFMYFPWLNRYLVIDFDLSASMNGQNSVSTKVTRGSAQALKMPSYFRSLFHRDPKKMEETVLWKKVDDFAMLAEYVMSKRVEVPKFDDDIPPK